MAGRGLGLGDLVVVIRLRAWIKAMLKHSLKDVFRASLTGDLKGLVQGHFKVSLMGENR